MSRVSVGVTLSMVAIALAAAGIAGYFAPVCGVWPVTDRAHMVLHFFDGRVRVFWITSEHTRIEVRPDGLDRPDLFIRRLPPRPSDPFTESALPWAVGSERLMRIRIGSRRSVGSFGGQWQTGPVIPRSLGGTIEVSYFRLPVWLPVILLLIQPVRAVVSGPWLWRRRQRNNLCQACGYERTGLIEPRCPECGTPHGAEPDG